MFKKSLEDKLKRIFDLPGVTFDIPSESQEQEGAFVLVDLSKNRIRDGKEIAYVKGKIKVFSNSDKLPYGYFSKKIKEAKNEDTSQLIFFDLEENQGTFTNISERTLSFVYLYEAQYDPEQGTITSLDATYQEA